MERQYLYCGEDIITHQVIVQQGKSKSLKDVTELVGKDIYVKPGKYYDRLVNLNNELGEVFISTKLPVTVLLWKT